MKTRIGHIIGCVGEEAGEIGQAIGKIIRFGLHDKKHDDGPDNLTSLRNEVHDLVGAYQMLCVELGEDPKLDLSKIADKQVKIEHYIQYAKNIDHLKDDKTETSEDVKCPHANYYRHHMSATYFCDDCGEKISDQEIIAKGLRR